MFEEMLAQLNVQVRGMILDNMQDIISLEGSMPLLLTRKQVAKLIGVGVNSFDDYYRYEPDFPQPDRLGRWKKSEVVSYFTGGQK